MEYEEIRGRKCEEGVNLEEREEGEEWL